MLSDPHGDHVALAKAIEDLKSREPVDEVLIGGDIAQGGAQPREVVDEIRKHRWRSVRGNSDDLLVAVADGKSAAELMRPAEAAGHATLPRTVVARARWSVRRLGPERIRFLRSLPMSIELGPFPWGKVVLVHATPWSTEDIVLPDASPEAARRMVLAANARLVLYGHIHTPYQRRIDDAALVSVGAISGSNDQDPRPAYSIVTLGDKVSVEVCRVEWPAKARVAAYDASGVDQRFNRDAPGPLPIRSNPGEQIVLWS